MPEQHRQTGPEKGKQSRRTLLQALGVTGVGLGAFSGTAASDEDGESDEASDSGEEESNDDAPIEIDSCTVIDEPGEYELVADLVPDELDQPACIAIDSDDVTIYGNGHTIDLSETAYDGTRWFREPVCIAVNPWGRERVSEVAWETTIEDVEVRGAQAGIHSSLAGGGASESTFSGVTAADNEHGISFYVDGATLEDCVLEDNHTGVYLGGDRDVWGGSAVSLENCTVLGNGAAGIFLREESSVDVTASRIVENGIGIRSLEWTTFTSVEESHICRNDHYGILGEVAPAVDDPSHPEPPREAVVRATGNYWGASNGPSSFGNPAEPFTDPETGRPADGDGDAISQALEPGVSVVHFDPFADAPIEGVGARRE